MNTIKALTRYTLYTVLACVFLSSCVDRSYPTDIVSVADKPMIIYKAEKLEEKTGYGNTYRYAITNATKKGYTLYTVEKYNVGDTLVLNVR